MHLSMLLHIFDDVKGERIHFLQIVFPLSRLIKMCSVLIIAQKNVFCNRFSYFFIKKETLYASPFLFYIIGANILQMFCKKRTKKLVLQSASVTSWQSACRLRMSALTSAAICEP